VKGGPDLLATLARVGVTVAVDGDRLIVRPWSRVPDEQRAALRAHKTELLALLAAPAAGAVLPPARPYRLTNADADVAHAEPWNDAAIARFQARAGHIRRLGFSEDDADDLAEALHLRDLHADYRHLCLECRHYRPGRCGNHSAADLGAADLTPRWATMFQHCPGFTEVQE
jgi:hypothetical protein